MKTEGRPKVKDEAIGKWPAPKTIEDIQQTVIAIVSDYSCRSSAYQRAYSWLCAIPRDLTLAWLKYRKINTSEELWKKLAYIQTKHRKFVLAQRRKEQEEFERGFEKWLLEHMIQHWHLKEC